MIKAIALILVILCACFCIRITSFKYWERTEDIQLHYYLDREPFIHPFIVDDFAARDGDLGDQIVEINLHESQGTNRYYGQMHCGQLGENEKYPTVSAVYP